MHLHNGPPSPLCISKRQFCSVSSKLSNFRRVSAVVAIAIYFWPWIERGGGRLTIEHIFDFSKLAFPCNFTNTDDITSYLREYTMHASKQSCFCQLMYFLLDKNARPHGKGVPLVGICDKSNHFCIKFTTQYCQFYYWISANIVTIKIWPCLKGTHTHDVDIF